MKKIINKTSRWVFNCLCILIGLYPVIYFLIDRRFGLLASKSQELLSHQMWNFGFYGHIVLGGIALLIGWTQFSATLRTQRKGLHRIIGKIYIIAVLISGTCGIYIAQYATGGVSNVVGFTLNGIIWLITTVLAYQAIRNGKVKAHEGFMVYSYAVCFSAVTLRIWLPILIFIAGEFELAYLIVGWLSWVPNLIVAYFIVDRKNRKPAADIALA
jgi:uncharacterized membrane protein